MKYVVCIKDLGVTYRGSIWEVQNEYTHFELFEMNNDHKNNPFSRPTLYFDEHYKDITHCWELIVLLS